MMSENPVQPIFILSEGSTRRTGRNAQATNIAAAKAVAQTVRTTLGPKGMDKMLVDGLGDVTVTNDGVTILREMSIDNPAAKMIIEIAKTQEDDVGDGTTTAVVLAGELLHEAEELLAENIHPTIIAKGYRIALAHAIETLESLARPVTVRDDDLLAKIARTAMTGKGVEGARETLAPITVKAAQAVYDLESRRVDLDAVKIEKKPGADITESRLIEGIVLDKERVHAAMPKKVRDAKIALLSCALEIRTSDMDTKISINDPAQVQGFLDVEDRLLKEMADAIAASGAQAVFCQKGIDEVVQHYLAKRGILAVRRIGSSDIEKIAKATGAKVAGDVRALRPEDLGRAGLVEERKVGEDRMLFIEECANPKAVTLLVRSSTEHVTEEAKRAVDDALGDLAAVLRNARAVGGAGAPESEMAKELRRLAQRHAGREQLAILAFAKAMEIIPKTLAENSGIDPIDALTELRSAHDGGQAGHGLDVESGDVADAWKAGIIEPLAVKTRAVSSACEVGIMILRIDDVIEAAQPEQK